MQGFFIIQHVKQVLPPCRLRKPMVHQSIHASSTNFSPGAQAKPDISDRRVLAVLTHHCGHERLVAAYEASIPKHWGMTETWTAHRSSGGKDVIRRSIGLRPVSGSPHNQVDN